LGNDHAFSPMSDGFTGDKAAEAFAPPMLVVPENPEGAVTDPLNVTGPVNTYGPGSWCDPV